MLIAQLFLVVSISVATSDIIVNSNVQNSAATTPVDCGGKVCKNGATCKTGNTCDCPIGTKGDECEIVIGCDKLKAKCDKINSECIYNPVLWTPTCKCDGEKEKFNGEVCEECDCGEFMTHCEFPIENKYCFCKKGYSNYNGTCSPCACGEFEKRCLIDKDNGNKVCICKDGYSEKSGICTPCTCGNHTITCGFATGDKYCICDAGYQFKLGTCEECDCGENSTSCMFDKADKLCSCKSEDKPRFGICTTCECGPDAICKFTSSGDKKCDCIGPLCHEPGTPWNKNPVVIVCIVLPVSLLVFGIAFVAYRKLRSNRSGY